MKPPVLFTLDGSRSPVAQLWAFPTRKISIPISIIVGIVVLKIWFLEDFDDLGVTNRRSDKTMNYVPMQLTR